MKIKNILKTVTVAALAVGAAGCKSLLDLNPPMSDTTNNFYLNQEQVYQSLISAYSVLNFSAPQTAAGGYTNCAFEVTSEILGDCCYAGGEGGAGYDQNNFRRSTFNMRSDDPAAEALWRKYYIGIYRCNLFFANVDNPPFNNENDRKQYKAEAHFLRAYYYFDLVRLYGNVPLVLKELSPSDYAFPQSTPEEVYGQIAKDLLEAIGATDDNGDSVMYPDAVSVPVGMKGRVSLAAVKALLARVWLYYTGYYGVDELPGVSAETVRGYLEDIITGTRHDLMPNAYDLSALETVGVTPMFEVANNDNIESVFEIQFSNLGKAGYGNRIDSRGNQAVLLWGIRTDAAPFSRGWSYAPVDASLWSKFSDSDPRRRASIISIKDDGLDDSKIEKGFQHTGYFARKYTALAANESKIGGDKVLNWPNNFYVIRFADVLLMASEMELLHGGSRTKAFEYYKRVRERALGAGRVGITEDELDIDKIYNERLCEFALEGIRYWDILRRGQDYAEKTLTRDNDDEWLRVTYDREKAGLFPIPLYEIMQSKYNLKQNPGYSN